MQKLLARVANNLLLLAVLAVAFGLFVPSVGIALSVSIGPLLAALMLVSPPVRWDCSATTGLDVLLARWISGRGRLQMDAAVSADRHIRSRGTPLALHGQCRTFPAAHLVTVV